MDILQPLARPGPVSDTPAHRFLAELWSTTQENWLNPQQRIIAGGAGVECVPSIHDWTTAIHISDIVAAKPGQGAGRKALAHLLDLADKHGVRLDLTAEAYVKGRMTSKQLHDWYARLGFTKMRGNARDGYRMVRLPVQAGGVRRELLPLDAIRR